MTLDERERVVLETLKRLPKPKLVLIGGYAVNAYVPPRFSIDCDLVVLGGLGKIETILRKEGYKKSESGKTPYGSYVRYEGFPSKVSFDLMIGSVTDRDTKITFEDELFEEHSRKRTTVGKTAPVRIEMRIADPELLFAMKFVSARRQDIRDLFMLAGEDLQWSLVKRLVLEKCTSELITKRAELITSDIGSKDYRDSLQGPYGKVPDGKFEHCKKSLLEFVNDLSGSA